MTIKINLNTTGAIALGLGAMLALTACGGGTTDTRDLGSDAQPTAAVETPAPAASETATPDASATPIDVADIDVATDNGWGYDASQVEIPEDVRAAFGADADTVVNSALLITHVGYMEQPDFLTPGWTDEDYDLAWASFSENFLAPNLREESEENDTDYLMPTVSKDGVAGLIGGVEHTIPAGTVGIDFELATNPVVSLSESGDAVSVGFDLAATWNTVPTPATAEVYVRYDMIPAGEDALTDWVITSYRVEFTEAQAGE